MNINPVFVHLDGTPDFEAVSSGLSSWNGAAKPRFTRTQADRVAVSA